MQVFVPCPLPPERHMTKVHTTLEGVSYVLPNGRTLFSGLTEQFDERPTGLVGCNGVGKSVLARILAGESEPTTGRCVRSASVCHLSQQISLREHSSVASLAGVYRAVEALTRIEAGSSAQADFDAVGDLWDVRQRLQNELEINGLGYLTATTAASALSGGEAMRIAVLGALLTGRDVLILDEPSNHFDRENRRALLEQLRRWPRALLVVSHDRQLLDQMERIVELSSLGLRNYGGGYSFYARCKAHDEQNAVQQLERLKAQKRRQERSVREQSERQERRLARGSREARDANQAKVLLGRQKQRSEATSGKIRQHQTALLQQLSQQVRDATLRVEKNVETSLHALESFAPVQRKLVELEGVELPFGPPSARRVDLVLTGQQRLGVLGPNGCGKSTLLKVLAGKIEPTAGACHRWGRIAHLDQQLEGLDLRRSTLEQLRSVNGVMPEDALYTRLVHLGLDGSNIGVPSGELSGGERLKAALACVLYAEPRAELLLLDEPSNHLDLASVQALESMLRQYQGALVIVSHDDVFLDGLQLTTRLIATGTGWRLEPW
jgi:ATPase subunit of ABC transporter with duplicated ATPase domains